MSYVKNNIVFLTFMACYFAVNVVLFATRAAEFWRIELPDGTVVYGDYLYMLARGSGQFRAQLGHFVSVTDSIPHEGRALHFNGMFILVLMLRRSITFLRSKGFANFLPLDQHVYLHKMVGVAILGLSIFHSIMHVSRSHDLGSADSELQFYSSQWRPVKRNLSITALDTGWNKLNKY